MAKKSYSMLQKKLEEIETLLNELFSLPLDDAHQHHHVDSQDLEQRFLFVKNLLSAEIASTAPNKPLHLAHMAKRLSDAETAFHEWQRTKGNMETVSSVDESYILNDEGVGDGEISFEELIKEKAEAAEDMETYEVDKEKREEKGICVGSGRFCCGVVIGMALMSLVFVNNCGCFLPQEEHHFCLIPT